MNTLRAANFTGIIICLPLLIHLCGILNAGETSADIPSVILQSLRILWPLQITAIFLSTPWFIRDHSPIDCLTANMVMALIPLPFLCLAWLAAAISALTIIKILMILTAVSLLAIAMVWPCQSRTFPIRLDMMLCLLASAGIWMTSEQWLNWLQ